MGKRVRRNGYIQARLYAFGEHERKGIKLMGHAASPISSIMQMGIIRAKPTNKVQPKETRTYIEKLPNYSPNHKAHEIKQLISELAHKLQIAIFAHYVWEMGKLEFARQAECDPKTYYRRLDSAEIKLSRQLKKK